MKAKPKGAKYRNLTAYRGSIWFERVVRGRRYRVDLETAAWEEAAARRDAYEGAKGIATTKRGALGQVPTLADFATRYLEEDTEHLESTTRTDRRSHLAEDGPVLRHLGRKRLDEVTSAMLREWWNAEIQGGERSVATGHRYLASIAGAFNYAVELGLVDETPVDALRRQFSRRRRSKSGRAEQASKANPIEDHEALARLIEAASTQGALPCALVLALLDAGLRFGEALALRWRTIAWGTDDEDPRRHLLVEASFSRGSGEESAPKSGRSRRVQLSRRLRAALGELYLERRPGRDELVFQGLDPRRFREDAWATMIEEADLPGRVPKDLRDTYGSQLVSAGIPLLYVSRQLGHSTTAVTEKHYAKWIPGDGDLYVEPLPLESGEVPADLLARLRRESPQSPHTGDPFEVPDFSKSLRMQ